MCGQKNSSESFVSGAVLGIIAGAALGFLLSPNDGKESRDKIKKAAKDLKDKAQPIFDEHLVPIVDRIKETVEPIKEDLMEEIQDLSDGVGKSIRRGFKK